MGDLIAMVKDAVVPLAGFMAVTAMLGVVIVMYKQTIMAVINTLLYRCHGQLFGTKHLRNGDEYEINNRKFGILYNPCYHVLYGDRVYTDEHGRKQGK